MKTKKQNAKSTFTVIFFIQRCKSRPDGTAPILARITVNGQMTNFSTKLYIRPERWLPLDYRTVGKTAEEKRINEILYDLRATIKQKYYDMVYRGEVVTAEKIKSSMFSLDNNCMTLIDLCNKFIEQYEKLVLTKDHGQESFFRYKICRTRLQEFMRAIYKVNDMPLQDINKQFLDKLYLWLRSDRQLCNNTAVKFLHRFSSIFRMARDNGWVTGDPFNQLSLHLDKVDRGYLTRQEIVRIQTKVFESQRLERVRDIFLFSCYTGLSYIDIRNLTEDHIKERGDGTVWILFKRQKTKVPFTVRLFDVPLQILSKYSGYRTGKHLLPVPTNQKCNEYLKEIASVCGIDKTITFHMARHTFATTITLENGVPIETVSKMLGHTNVRTTQIYARITDQKITSDMAILEDKLVQLNNIPIAVSRESQRLEEQYVEIERYALNAGLI